MSMRTWDLLADSAVQIDGYSLEGLLYDGDGWPRRTTLVWLEGGGARGVGEDVNYFPGEQEAFQARGATLPLQGAWTLAGLARHLDMLPLFDTTPEYPGNEAYRRWAFESAALDLALRQADTTTAARLGRPAQPVEFVASLSLGDEKGLTRLRRLHRALPELGFKLDATAFWDSVLVAELVAMDRVRVVDFKGAYVGTTVDQAPEPELYQRIVDALPEALLEDPHRTPECDEVLATELHRVSWDAPIHSADDIDGLEHAPRMINLKPSRFGSLERLCDAYDYCHDRQIGTYGGGQSELGPGRGQIQYLASLFHADAANDVAPVVFNTADAFDGLPAGPLPPPSGNGFR